MLWGGTCEGSPEPGCKQGGHFKGDARGHRPGLAQRQIISAPPGQDAAGAEPPAWPFGSLKKQLGAGRLPGAWGSWLLSPSPSPLAALVRPSPRISPPQPTHTFSSNQRSPCEITSFFVFLAPRPRGARFGDIWPCPADPGQASTRSRPRQAKASLFRD